MSASNYLEGAVLSAILNKQTYTGGNVYVGLYNVAPTESTSGTELTGNGYSRQIANFAVSSGTALNVDGIGFPATGAWLAAKAVAILDASTGGNVLLYKNLGTAKTIGNAETITFAANSISISVD